MKNLIFISTSAAISLLNLFACGTPEQDYYTDDNIFAYASEYQEAGMEGVAQVSNSGASNNPGKKRKNKKEKVEMRAIKNPKTGEVTQYMPIPASWKTSGSKITGPGNLEIQEYQYQSFNTFQRRVMSARQIAQNIFGPSLQNEGSKIIKITDMPEMARKDAQNSDLFYSAGGGYRKTFDAVGVDVLTSDGKPVFLIIHQSFFNFGDMGMWGYATHSLTSNKSEYESAKSALIYALLNLQADKNYIARANNRMQRESQQSWAAHNSRMKSNQAAFQATQKAYTDASNSVSDIYMDTWKNTNASSDRMQSMTVNGINGTEVVQDPMYGGQYEVQSGYDRYFMNNSGEYVGTNDQFYQTGSDLYADPDVREVQRRGNR